MTLDRKGRTCGDCSLCCKVMAVEELSKPRGTWCKHCSKPGCRIYDAPQKPKICSTFECLWLQGAFGDDMKPSRSRIVATPTTDGLGVCFHVDPVYPGLMSGPLLNRYLASLMRERVDVIVACGDRRKLYPASRVPLEPPKIEDIKL